jgi:hypothetical protein
MEHPLISDADSLNIDDLAKKITLLQNKLSIARRTGNGYLCSQISMAMETYRTAHSRKLEESFSKNADSTKWLDGKIDIS